jgi:hypothetical protein
LNYKKDQIVSHPSFGLGRIFNVSQNNLTVFFRNSDRNPIKLSTATPGLKIVDGVSDSWLNSNDLAVQCTTTIADYLSSKSAVQKFLSFFPGGFADPDYLKKDRTPKWEAHEMWNATLNESEFKRLLDDKDFGELTARTTKIALEGNLFTAPEKTAVRESLAMPEVTHVFFAGLYDMIYGSESFSVRFEKFGDIVGRLPLKKTSTLKWPLQTIFLFFAFPDKYLFLKPTVTQEAARRRGFTFNYSTHLSLDTYASLLRFSALVLEDIKDLAPKDMIDVQSFINATGDASYLKGKEKRAKAV